MFLGFFWKSGVKLVFESSNKNIITISADLGGYICSNCYKGEYNLLKEIPNTKFYAYSTIEKWFILFPIEHNNKLIQHF